MSELTAPGSAETVKALTGPWLAEVESLRKVTMPSVSAGPREVYARLIEVRANLDRVEEILMLAMALKSAAVADSAACAAAAADALDVAISDRAKRAREYEAARERLADAHLATFEEQRKARTAARLADAVAGVEDRIKIAYRGLVTLRADLSDALRYTSFESSLDR